MFSPYGVWKRDMSDNREKGETMKKNNRHALHIAASMVLVLLLTVSVSMGDSFVADDGVNIFTYTAAADGSQKDGQEISKDEMVTMVADSFVVESDFEVQGTATGNWVDLSETMVVGLNQGDSFLSRSDIQTLSSCSLDRSSGSIGFLVCTLN